MQGNVSNFIKRQVKLSEFDYKEIVQIFHVIINCY